MVIKTNEDNQQNQGVRQVREQQALHDLKERCVFKSHSRYKEKCRKINVFQVCIYCGIIDMGKNHHANSQAFNYVHPSDP
jgi:hypothetical protein